MRLRKRNTRQKYDLLNFNSKTFLLFALGKMLIIVVARFIGAGELLLGSFRLSKLSKFRKKDASCGLVFLISSIRIWLNDLQLYNAYALDIIPILLTLNQLLHLL